MAGTPGGVAVQQVETAVAADVPPVMDLPGAPIETGAPAGPAVDQRAEVSPPMGPRLSPQEIMKAIENDPIIRRANELFGAKINDQPPNP